MLTNLPRSLLVKERGVKGEGAEPEVNRGLRDILFNVGEI